MPAVVQKYGGSSVADVEKLKRVAAKVAARRRAGDDVCVVVSAMGDATDDLLQLAKQVSADPPRRELDMLLTAGERISMALLSIALQELGVEAISFTGSQAGIITTDAHATARILEVRPIRVREELARGKVVIVAGFQGVSAQEGDHHAGARRLRHHRGGAGGGARRRLRDLQRRGRGLHRRPARGARGAAPARALLRGDAGAGAGRRQGAQRRRRWSSRGPPASPSGRAAPSAAPRRRWCGPGAASSGSPAWRSRRSWRWWTCRPATAARALALLAAAHAPASARRGGAGARRAGGGAGERPRLRAAGGGAAARDRGARITAEGIGAVTVVGTGVAATPRVREALVAALARWAPRRWRIESGPLEVTVYAETRWLADTAREVHRRLIG